MVLPRISIVLPVYNERENIAACLRGLWQALSEHEHEILVCYDFDEDSTLPAIAAMTDKPPSLRLVKNSLGRGAAFAIRAGFEAAQGDVVVTTMADLCDPPEVIPRMADKIRQEGADVVAGSRYMRGGSQSGGPWLKRTISRWVGWSMWWIAKLGTHDATTNFRAYSKRFLDTVTVESKTSFDIALELTVKAHLAGAKVSEVPSSWIDRTAGESRFQMWKWMPNYLRWYLSAMAAPAFVGFVWIAMCVSLVWIVGTYGSPIPFEDDLDVVCILSPERAVNASWLWSPHNEHRIPLARLIYVGIMHFTTDIRAVMCAEVVILALIALGMIAVAQRLRGRTSYVDAFFPLIWLHAGNSENLLMAFQISVMIPTAIVCGILIAITTSPPLPSWKRGLAIGVALALLPLNGGHGLTQAPALIVWLGWAGIHLGFKGECEARAAGRVMCACAIATALLVCVYFIGLDTSGGSPKVHDLAGIALPAAQFLALSLGPSAQFVWPFSLWLVAGLCAITVALLVRVACTDARERVRAVGILACMGGVITMAIAVGLGRGHGNDIAGFATRYVTLPASILCSCWFAWSLYGWKSIGRLVHVTLAFAACALLASNAEIGMVFGQGHARRAVGIARDVNAGMPIAMLANSYSEYFYTGPRDFEARLRILDRMHFPPFTHRATEPPPAPPTPDDETLKSLPTVPTGYRSQRRILSAKVDGQPVVAVRPPGELRFNLTRDVRSIHGRFGMLPQSWEQGGRAGVAFTVEYVPFGGEARVLFARSLEPVRNERDRGPQSFDVALPRTAAGEVVLRTTQLPDVDHVLSWSYWAAVTIVERRFEGDTK